MEPAKSKTNLNDQMALERDAIFATLGVLQKKADAIVSIAATVKELSDLADRMGRYISIQEKLYEHSKSNGGTVQAQTREASKEGDSGTGSPGGTGVKA